MCETSATQIQNPRNNILQVLREMGMSNSLMDRMVEVCNKMDKLEEYVCFPNDNFSSWSTTIIGLDKA